MDLGRTHDGFQKGLAAYSHSRSARLAVVAVLRLRNGRAGSACDWLRLVICMGR